MRLSAISLSSRISRLLDYALRGSIIASFSRSCYIELDGHIIAVVGADLLNGPLNLVVSLPDATMFADVPVGAVVEVRGRVLRIADRWHVDATQAQRWDARLTRLGTTAGLRRRLSAIQTILDADAPPESLARAEGRPRRAAEAMALLAAGLREGDIQRVGKAAHELAGLGPGLTPSGDDVLAGALLAVAVLGPAHAQGVRDIIMASVRGRTTRISEAYLDAAAEGEAGEAWHWLVATLQREESVDQKVASSPPQGDGDLRTAVQRILAFGETSGADMLAGFVLAMTALRPA